MYSEQGFQGHMTSFGILAGVLTISPLASYVTSLRLTFLTYKMIIVVLHLVPIRVN